MVFGSCPTLQCLSLPTRNPKARTLLMNLFRIASKQWWTPAELFMATLFYFEDNVHLKKLQRAKKYPLFLSRMLGTILEYYGFPTKPEKEKKHHCRKVYTISRWQGSVTKIESTFTSVSLTTDNEHHYEPPSNLILEDFSDEEDTPLRPPVAPTPEKPTSVHDATPLSIPTTQETNSSERESTLPTTIVTSTKNIPSPPSYA
ncbi:hypothetical protein CK203_054629 [Vitis vinifera]|uniref:Uncharacterized protein n=1 Tax=Vitis vinifera TaxID=29760 RepID=A0A438GRQ0_VITVI|nr:hypothetical protein CK203_054629 [Vitis vinifera]